MLKGIIITLCITLSFMTYGQENINDYKYLIVPKQFKTFKQPNAYKTSTLIKYHLGQKGFTVIYDDALPEDLIKNRCLGLLVSLNDESSMFATKTTLSLENCKGEEVFRTLEGQSRKKSYKDAYTAAIKQALVSFDSVSYAYNGMGEGTEPITVSFKNDVKRLPENSEIPAKEVTTKEPVKSTTETSLVVQEATTTNQFYESKEPVASDIKMAEKPAPKKLKIRKPTKDDMLYAQSVPNGYQLVDSAPKIRMKLLKSSKENIYLVQGDSKNGMVYQKGDKWIFEYYEGDKLMQEELKIKF